MFSQKLVGPKEQNVECIKWGQKISVPVKKEEERHMKVIVTPKKGTAETKRRREICNIRTHSNHRFSFLHANSINNP